MFPYTLDQSQMAQLKAEDSARIASTAKLGACPLCGSMLGTGKDAKPNAMKIKPPDDTPGVWYNCHACGNKFRFDN